MSHKVEQHSQIGPAFETATTEPMIPAAQGRTLNWLLLSEATILIDHDVQKARERLERAIKKAWLVGPPGLPQPALDPNVPLRIQVTSLPGWRLEGRAWLDDPVLHWEASEIECLCKPWTPLSKTLASVATTQFRVKIEIWAEDLAWLWGSDKSMGSAATYAALIAPAHVSVLLLRSVPTTRRALIIYQGADRSKANSSRSQKQPDGLKSSLKESLGRHKSNQPKRKQ